MKYYAYFLSAKKKGVCESWEECKKLVFGKEARFKSFKNKKEAEEWLNLGARYEMKIKKKLEPGIYFDAGTGRGKGVEVSVANEREEDLLSRIIAKNLINRFGKHLIRGKATNNYGELLACKYALLIASKSGIKKIFGDSNLVIKYWSKGILKKNRLSLRTVKLIQEVTKLRKDFEATGGIMKYISGDDNPADLGFHR